MNRRTYLPLLLIICLSIPLEASAQYTITKISGDGQTGNPGQTLKPFVVEVRQNGNPVGAGIFVTFLHDRGSATGVPVQTDANGRASSTLTLGRGAGTTTVTVSVGNPPVSVTFTATTVIPTPPRASPKPTRLFIVSGDNQTGIIGETLAERFVVRVRDQYNKTLEGVAITFTVLTGGGSLSTTTTITDISGRATSRLTLGNEPGTNTVEARASGISEVRIFSAEATLPPPAPTRLLNISGDNQTGVISEVLAAPFVVEVRDQRGDPMEGVTIIFTVLTGGGALSAGTAMTDANGWAESTLTLGSDPGTNTVSASVDGITETVTFSAEATTPPLIPTTLQTVSDDDPGDLTDGTDPFVVQVHDQDGNPLEDVPVTFTILEEDGSMSTTNITTDANGRAEITLPPGIDPGTYTITGSVEGIAETVAFTVVVPLEFDLFLPAGLNLIHIPLKVRAVGGTPVSIESVADLYDVLGGADTVNYLITHNSQTQEWHGYFGDADRGTITDSVLTDQTGILASIKTPVTVRLSGDALGEDGLSAITLNQGLNLVGLPLNDPRLTRVSDLFALEGIAGNVAAIVVTDNGEFKLVGRAGDAADIAITGGSAFILIAQGAATVPILGTGWANVP